MMFDKTAPKETPAGQQRPWEDRNEGMLREESDRDRRQAEELEALNLTLETLKTPQT